MKDRFTKLGLRYELENNRSLGLQEEYKTIEYKLLTIKAMKTQIEECKRASGELEFHQQRYKGVIDRIRAHKETIKNQEEIIHNLAY